MKMYHLYFIQLLLCLSLTVHAQTKSASTVNTQTKPVSTVATQTKTSTSANTASRPVSSQARPSFSSASDSIKYAINDFKSSVNNLFGSKKDTIDLVISNVEYDDAGLEGLKENVKKIKGARFLGMQFKASVAKIELSFKGKPTELWDQLPADIRKPFKILEVTDNNLILSNRVKQ
jgi:hypothetical protein